MTLDGGNFGTLDKAVLDISIAQIEVQGVDWDTDDDGRLENQGVEAFANFSSGDVFDAYPITSGDIETDAVTDSELDLSITPAWTGQHQFGSGIDIEGNWILDSESEGGVERLRIQGTGVDDAAELFIQAKGSANASRITVTPDSSSSNYSALEFESNGTSQIIDATSVGTETTLPLEIQVDGTVVATFTTTPDLDVAQNLNLSGGDLQRNGTTVVSTQESAVASLTNNQTSTTTDGALEAVGDTSAGDESAPIERNFTELNTKVDAILTALRNHGLIAT